MIDILFSILFAQLTARGAPACNCISTVKSSACFPHDVLFISLRSKLRTRSIEAKRAENLQILP